MPYQIFGFEGLLFCYYYYFDYIKHQSDNMFCSIINIANYISIIRLLLYINLRDIFKINVNCLLKMGSECAGATLNQEEQKFELI